MKGIFIMGVFQDMNRASIAQELKTLYEKTASITVICKPNSATNSVEVKFPQKIRDEQSNYWDIKGTIHEVDTDVILRDMKEVKFHSIDSLKIHLYASSGITPERVDLGYRKVLASLGNANVKVPESIYMLLSAF